MTQDSRCPSCGHENTAEATQCARCNFPLHGATAASAPAAPTPTAANPTAEPVISRERIRPVRPRRPGGPDQGMKTQLWLVIGGLTVLAVAFGIYSAAQEFQKTQLKSTVEGAKPEQQAAADMARAALAKDSTNVNAQVALADVLYDTANWPEAIIHYRAVLRLDPTRTTTMVDMGVCYFNLSKFDVADSLWKQALKFDPNLAQALFNLGFLNETNGDLEAALKYYHQAMRSAPPGMGPSLADAIKRVSGKLGRTAPPLPAGANEMPGGMPAGGMPPGGGK